jgi:hypothetical protein
MEFDAAFVLQPSQKQPPLPDRAGWGDGVPHLEERAVTDTLIGELTGAPRSGRHEREEP